MKKIFALLLTIIILISIMPLAIIAEGNKLVTKIEITLPLPTSIPATISDWSKSIRVASFTEVLVYVDNEEYSTPTEIIDYEYCGTGWLIGLKADDELCVAMEVNNNWKDGPVSDIGLITGDNFWMTGSGYIYACDTLKIAPSFSNKRIGYSVGTVLVSGCNFATSADKIPVVVHNTMDLSKNYSMNYFDGSENHLYVFIDLGTVDANGNIVDEVPAAVEEDTAPVVATAERIEKYGIPKIFIGDDRPEIKVLTDFDTYEYNENQYSAEAPIIIENGRTYLGLRDIAYSLGIDPMAIRWNETIKTASISKSGSKIELTEGSSEMIITYKGYIYTQEIDSPAFIRDGRIYVPFRAIFEAFGYSVNWDNETRTITCK